MDREERVAEAAVGVLGVAVARGDQKAEDGLRSWL